MNEKHLYTTLGATVQSGSVTDETITDSSVIEIYFDEPDVYIKSSSQSGHTVNFTVDGNLTGVNVCVVVNNLTDFVPFDGEGIENRVSALESDIDTITSEMETISTEIETLDNKVNNLSASSINYDEHSTLYSAMGDIDELETESKNLVGAINEVKESGYDNNVYDNNERVIGEWFGKPLYRRVVKNPSEFTIAPNTWKVVDDITVGNISMKDFRFTVGEELVYCGVGGRNISGKLQFMHHRNATLTLYTNTEFVMEYTKVGD